MVVCDSGPLIHVSRIGRLGLLRDLFKQVEISTSVHREVVEGAKALGKPGVSTIEHAIEEGWMRITEVEEKGAIKKLAENERIQ
jgi:predicted nucleic acid-binding protein